MILKNAMVVTGDFKLKCCDIEIKDKLIVRIGENLDGEEIIDMTGKYILPGFIDVHIHGACGDRISDENPDVKKILKFEATQGVTSVALSLAVNKYENMLKQIDLIVKESKETNNTTKIIAINSEGPFLNKKYKGAMGEENIITPDVNKLDEMIKHGNGLLKIVAVAPEAENALEFVKHAVDKGITVSLGHTNATYEEAMKAIDAGATHSVHTFNAMRPFNHREPGVLGAVLTDDRVNCEAICDYVHLNPVTIDILYKLKGADRMIMVSDSVNAAGIEMDEFVADGVKHIVKDGVVRLLDGTIAGSSMTLLNGVQNLIKSGIPIEDVAKMSSYNPAKSIKKEKEVGSIAEGKIADLVVLDSNYNVSYTYINGVCVYKEK